MEKINALDTNNTVIDDQNTTTIQRELCIYREIDYKCKDVVFDSKYNGIFNSSEPKKLTQLIDTDNSECDSDSDSDDDDDVDSDDDVNSHNTNIEYDSDNDKTLGPLYDYLKSANVENICDITNKTTLSN